MKRNMKHIAWIAAGASMLFTACIGDLDTLPLNPSDSTSETVYGADESGYIAGLTKLDFNFVSNETTDLQVSDAGASELVRAFWTVQEVTSDACKCAWENDAWVRAMNTNTWSDADNDATYAVYVRTLQGIAYTNEYLRQTASDRLSDRGVSSELAAKIQGFRAEARFRYDDIGKTERRLRRNDGVAAMRDIGEGSAVNDGRSSLQGLYQVGL